MPTSEIDEDPEIPNIPYDDNYPGILLMADHRIVEIMDELGVSQAELARRMKVPPTEVNKWYHGQRRMTLERMKNIAAALNVRVSDLLVDRDFKNRLSDQEHSIMDSMRTLSPVDQLRLTQIADILSNKHSSTNTDD